MSEFQYNDAVRSRVPLLLGVTGYTGSGKTWSSLRLATGMQQVIGGQVALIDTECNRALQLADRFKFKHVSLSAPFSSLRYLAAMEFCKSKGASIVIVDSMTHEHSSEGGYLDQSEQFLDRKCGEDEGKRHRMSAQSYKTPAQERKKLNDWIIHSGLNAIFCYRAKEKMDFKTYENAGWQPETTSALIWEMTARFLLTPGSDGKPTFNPQLALEKMLTKNPEFFRDWFKQGQQLDETLGVRLAEWAKGGIPRPMEQSNAEPIRNTGGTGSANGASENHVPPHEAQPTPQSADGADRTSDLSPGGPCAVEGPIKFGKSTNAAYWNIVCCDLWLSYKHGSFGAQAKAIETAYKANPGCNFHIEYTESPWEKNGKSGINRTIVHMEPM